MTSEEKRQNFDEETKRRAREAFEQMHRERMNKAHESAIAQLNPEERGHFVSLFFDGAEIKACRTIPGKPAMVEWVNVSALLGNPKEGSDVDEGVEKALDALWPEAGKQARMMIRIVANMAAKAGGLLGG